MNNDSSNIRVLHDIPGRIRFRVPGIRFNSGLIGRISDRLEQLDGVIWVRGNRRCASLAVGYRPRLINSMELVATIGLVGQSSLTSGYGQPAAAALPGQADPVRRAGLRFAGLTAVTVWAFIRETILKATVNQALFSPLGLVTAVGAWPMIKKAIKDFRERRFSLDGFLAGSILTATAMGEAMTALEILWIESGADLLAAWVKRRSRRAVSEILQVTSRDTFICVDGKEVEVAVDQVRVNDLVVLHTGEKISVDGEIESGRALIDESPINGRSEFILREPGDRVLAGTLVREGVIYVRADKVGDQTYLARVIHLVEDALETQAPIQGAADKLALRLLKLGGTLTLGVLVVTASFWRAFTVLLVMACPCATVLAASAPISAAISAAARRRILIKGGLYLEEIGQADVVCFDKTGTLTMSEPILAHVVNLSDRPDSELIRLAYSAEMHNFHPLAMAVKQRAAELDITPENHVVCQYQLGEGVTAQINGNSVYVGNRRFMDRHGIDLSPADGAGRELEGEGLTIAFLALDQDLLAVLGFANQIRPEAKALVRYLAEDQSKRLVMITGEESCTAGPIGARLGIDECHFSVLPRDKARLVAELKAEGSKVLMVGDGINDALALAEADIGAAMGAGGSEVAIEAADIALVNDDLNGIAYLDSLSRETLKVVHQNFWIAVGSNLGGMALGAVGLLSPPVAGLIHIFHTVGILANSSRIFHHKGPFIHLDEAGFKPRLISPEDSDKISHAK